jgi:hypothetical protein
MTSHDALQHMWLQEHKRNRTDRGRWKFEKGHGHSGRHGHGDHDEENSHDDIEEVSREHSREHSRELDVEPASEPESHSSEHKHNTDTRQTRGRQHDSESDLEDVEQNEGLKKGSVRARASRDTRDTMDSDESQSQSGSDNEEAEGVRSNRFGGGSSNNTRSRARELGPPVSLVSGVGPGSPAFIPKQSRRRPHTPDRSSRGGAGSAYPDVTLPSNLTQTQTQTQTNQPEKAAGKNYKQISELPRSTFFLKQSNKAALSKSEELPG